MKTEKNRYSVKDSVKSSFTSNRVKDFSNRIKDISNVDCSMHYNEECPLEEGEEGILNLKLVNEAGEQTDDVSIDAVIKHKRDSDNCLVIVFKEIADNSKYFNSIKKERILYEKRQASLAEKELIELKNEILLVKECQIKLFLTCFTLSIALGSLLGFLRTTNASFYVITILTISPAYIALIFAILALQKSMCLNRLVSFVLILKKQLIENDFYPKYRGWDDAVNNLYTCDDEECQVFIALIGNNFKDIGKLLSNIKKTLYTIKSSGQSFLFSSILFCGYLFIFFSSLLVTVCTLVMKGGSCGFAAIAVTVVSVFVGSSVMRYGYKVHAGRYSLVYYYHAWEHTLTNCDRFDPVGRMNNVDLQANE
jgi:hypothetical protein